MMYSIVFMLIQVELADAVVQCGRSTLEWTIKTIESHPSWMAKVLYGDTDSVFVLLKGRDKSQAFEIGKNIADTISKLCPTAVVLKFEKVYSNIFLLTKKRYTGFCYHSEDQKEPTLDAKGIELVRRDQCGVTQKIQEKSLKIFFKSQNLNYLRHFLCDQWVKMHLGIGYKIPLQDFVFRKVFSIFKKKNSI